MHCVTLLLLTFYDKYLYLLLFFFLLSIGLQEVTKRQLDDLQILLGDDFAHIGIGRDDGKEGGEYSPIFYKK